MSNLDNYMEYDKGIRSSREKDEDADIFLKWAQNKYFEVNFTYSPLKSFF